MTLHTFGAVVVEGEEAAGVDCAEVEGEGFAEIDSAQDFKTENLELVASIFFFFFL